MQDPSLSTQFYVLNKVLASPIVYSVMVESSGMHIVLLWSLKNI